ncbi:ribosomal 5S rRNA E-loop binding protein Ctc/L25/TL5 [Dehalogenimonas lykanthroporepellens BL-DC-9]|nr:ribosomal 5S rRNA E-loop binding protein Ctc/L25/TL5 [Dehalogenimonas lykanthroporepellens BL-DC-9]
MEKISLAVARRETTGKKNRFLRRAGVTPCHIYGHSIASETVQADTAALEQVIATAGSSRLVSLEFKGKKPRMAFVREVQRPPVGNSILHVDFYQVKMTEKIAARIPLHLTGESAALKAKGRYLTNPIDHIEVESLPANIPASVTVDISVLETLDDAIYVSDLGLDKSVTLLTDPETLVAKIAEAHVKAEEEELEGAGETGEAGGESAEETSGTADES